MTGWESTDEGLGCLLVVLALGIGVFLLYHGIELANILLDKLR